MVSYHIYEIRREKLIIVIGGEKGGTGKTTIATNIAAMRTHHNADVLMVDTDIQGSANSWSATRDENKAVKRIPCIQKFGSGLARELIDISKRYQEVIVDAGGRDSVELRASLSVADRLFIPIQASQFDVWTLGAMDNLIRQASAYNPKLRAHVVINRASTNPSVTELRDATEVLEDYDLLRLATSVIRDRISFRKAARSGLSVQELQPSDDKAIQEILSLHKEVLHD